MTLTFKCEHCHKKISAPDSAGGKRGKCPFCKESMYIPAPVAEDEILDMVPLDEEEEQQRRKLESELRARERDLIANSGGPDPVPLSERDDLVSDDLHHFVINYCLDMFTGNLARAYKHADDLKDFGKLGLEAVKYFQIVQGDEPALAKIPPPVVQGFLKDLLERL
jgi:hypothetical protein